MTARLCSENTTESVRNGFLELGVVQIWQVETPTRTTSADVVLLDPGLPAIGSAQAFGAYTLWLIDRAAVRVDPQDTGRKWHVTCSWSNLTQRFTHDKNGVPVQDPTLAVKAVDIQYLEYAIPVEDALLKNCTEVGPYGDPSAIVLPNPPYLPVEAGPVRVSTGELIEAQKPEYRQLVTVSRNEKVWDSSYESYTNTVNQLQVVIEETDPTGTTATYTYEPLTLRLKPIRKEPFWFDAKQYFKVFFEMEHDPLTWVHSEPDRSQKRRLFAGPPAQRKPDGTNYTQAEVNEAANSGATDVDFYYQPIVLTDDNGAEVAIGDPVPMNGYGNEMPYDRADGTLYNTDGKVFINYDVYEIKDWTPLGL